MLLDMLPEAHAGPTGPTGPFVLGEDVKVWVRASISLANLPAGQTALVDPHDPYIATCIRRGHLVLLDKAPR